MILNQILKTTILSTSFITFLSGCSTNTVSSNSVNKNSPIRQSKSSISKQVKEDNSQESDQEKAKSNYVMKPQDKKRFQQIMQYAKKQNLAQQSTGKIMSAIAQRFIGTPYEANLLDRNHQERLVISLTQFDCFIFVETMLALARGIKDQNYNMSSFQERLIEQRYREDQVNGYCSRLHYFSEWIQDNQRQGMITDITPKLGGNLLKENLNFMSSNRKLYPRLVNNDKNYQCIQKMEEKLEDLKIYYLPTNEIKSIYHLLESGDIVGIATGISGLDVSHSGLITEASREKVSLIHASPGGEVTIASDLVKYVKNVPSAKGILVARPVKSTL